MPQSASEISPPPLVSKRQNDGGIPMILADCTLASFDPSISPAAAAALQASMAFVDGRESRSDGTLLMSGSQGCGKSHLAAGIARAVWELEWRANQAAVAAFDMESQEDPRSARHPGAPRRPQWANMPDLFRWLRGGDRDAYHYARSLSDHRGLVVLDDLGREKITDWTGEHVYVLINERYERLLPTIVTSNLSIRELALAGYSPVVSRLAETGRVLEMKTAVDYRTRRP